MDRKPVSKPMVASLVALVVYFAGILANDTARYKFLDDVKREAISATTDYRTALVNCARTVEVERPRDGIPFSAWFSDRYDFKNQVQDRRSDFIAEWTSRN